MTSPNPGERVRRWRPVATPTSWRQALLRRPTLVIMARAPVAGTVKTRLHPLLGAEGCARLQTALIRHAAALDGGRGFLAHTPPGAAGLIRPLVGRRLTLFPQQGADLGDRMAAAVAVAAARRPGPVILIGTDCPVLRRAHLSAAAAQLAGGCDVVLGPAYDGGYYLIASGPPRPGSNSGSSTPNTTSTRPPMPPQCCRTLACHRRSPRCCDPADFTPTAAKAQTGSGEATGRYILILGLSSWSSTAHSSPASPGCCVRREDVALPPGGRMGQLVAAAPGEDRVGVYVELLGELGR